MRLPSVLLVAAFFLPLPAAAGDLPFAREWGGQASPGFEGLRRLVPPEALEEVFVVPRRPGKNRVRWYDFDFREVPLPELPGAGVTLFFYEAERPAAEVAAAIIREQYLRLVRAFDYVPSRDVPYILYATQFEFQATNAFPIGEGTLGVTSPVDLTLALPFFGDLEMFRHTSTHELAHEFTIQLVRSHGLVAGLPGGLGGYPLWFIEGLAEYAAYGGLDPEPEMRPGSPQGASGPWLPGVDPETEAWGRDLLFHSNPFEGYLILDYFADIPRGYVHTYKLGQLRVAFLGSTFGRSFVLWLLQNGHHMAGATEFGQGTSFARLVELGTGHDRATIDRMWSDWLRRRYLPAYAEARTRVPALELVDPLPTEPEAIASSPDGKTLLVRGIDREQGRSSLWLVDPEKPARAQRFAEDGRPGLESLHPVSRRTFAMGRDHVAWIGRDGPADVVRVARLVRRDPGSSRLFDLEDEVTYELVRADVLEAGDPAFSPDDRLLAFTGVGPTGQKDVFVLPLNDRGSVRDLRRVTDDVFAEADLSWSNRGIYLSSDATPDGHQNLFLLDPDSGARTPVATGPWNMKDPVPTEAGVVFASDRDGRWDFFRIEGDTVYRVSDVATMYRHPAPGPGGSLYGVTIYGGRFRLARLPPVEQLKAEPAPALDPGRAGVTHAVPRLPLPDPAPAYEPFEHFGLDAGAIAVGTQAVALGGLAFSDLLRDKVAAVQLAVYGDLELTDAAVYFLDQSHRLTWLAGLFHTFQPKRDRTFDEPAFPGDPDFYLEREFGLTGALVYPTSVFQRFQLSLTVGGVDRDRFTDKRDSRADEWNDRTGGSEPQVLLSGSYGLDTVRLHPAAGPISGSSLLLTVGGGALPLRVSDRDAPFHGWVEGDAQRYLYLGGRSVLLGRVAAGTAFGGRFSKQYYLSSVDNLRGFHWADERLLGTMYYVANAEVSFPLDWLIHLALFQGLRGVGGVDFGGVADEVDRLWEARSLAAVAGLDFLAGPLALRLHFGFPVQIGPVLPSDGTVTNVALRLRY